MGHILGALVFISPVFCLCCHFADLGARQGSARVLKTSSPPLSLSFSLRPRSVISLFFFLPQKRPPLEIYPAD